MLTYYGLESEANSDSNDELSSNTLLPFQLRRQGNANKGFASMDPVRQRQIASAGGKAAHAKGHAHEFTSEEAKIAGSKGGKAAHAKGIAHRFTSAEARAAGQKGGRAAQIVKSKLAESKGKK